MDIGVVRAVFIAETARALRNIEGFQRSLEDTAKGAQKVARKIGMAYIAMIGAISTASIKLALDWDEAMDRIAVATGATGGSLRNLQSIAENVYARTTRSSLETAGAIGTLNTILEIQGEELDRLSRKILYLSELTGIDATQAAEEFALVLNRFKIPASRAGELLDLLFAITQKTSIPFLNLIEILREMYPYLQLLGYSFEDSAILIGYLRKQGIDFQDLMRGLGRAADKASEKGITLRQALSYVSNQFKLAKTEAERTNLVMEWFGTRTGVILIDILERGALNVGKFRKHLGDTTNQIEKTRKETYGFAEAMKELSHRVELTLKDIGNQLVPILEQDVIPLLDKVSNFISRLVSFFVSLPSPIKKATLALIALSVGATAIGILGTMISKTIGGLSIFWGLLAKGTGILSKVIALIVTLADKLILLVGSILRTSFALGKMILSLIGLKGLLAVGIVIGLYITFRYIFDKDFRKKIQNVVNSLLEKAQNIFAKLKEIVVQVGLNIFLSVQKVFKKEEEVIRNIKTQIEEFWNNIVRYLQIEKVLEIFVSFATSIKNKVSDFVSEIRTKVETFWKAIENQLSFEKVLILFVNLLSEIKTKAGQIIDTIKEKIEKIWGEVKKGTIIERTLEIIVNFAISVRTTFEELIQKIREAWDRLWGNETLKIDIVAWADLEKRLKKQVVDTIDKKMKEAKDKSLQKNLQKMKETAETNWDKIFTAIKIESFNLLSSKDLKKQEDIVKELTQRIELIFKAHNINVSGLSQSLAQSIIETYQKMSDEVVGKSIVPDMWKAIEENFKKGVEKINETTYKNRTYLIRNWKELYRFANFQFDMLRKSMSLQDIRAMASVSLSAQVDTSDMQKAGEESKSLIDRINEFFQNLGTGIINLANNIRNFLSNIIQSVKNFFIPIVDWVNTNIILPIRNFFSNLWSYISNLAISFGNWLRDLGRAVFGSLYPYIEKEISKAFSWISGQLNSMFGGIFSQLSNLFGKFSNPLKVLFDLIVQFIPIQEILQEAFKQIRPALEEVRSALLEVVNALMAVLKPALQPFKEIVKIAADAIAKALIPVILALVPIIQALVPIIKVIGDLLKGPLLVAIKIFATILLTFVYGFALIWNAIISVLNFLLGWLYDFSSLYINTEVILKGIQDIWNYTPEKMQKGGIATKPTLAMIGEAGPEAVIPLKDLPIGTSIVINITGNYILKEEDVDELGERIVRALRMRGIY